MFSFHRFWSKMFGVRCHQCGRCGLSDDNPYFFHISGLGKHDSKTWCYKCVRKIP